MISETNQTNLADIADELKATGAPFVVATVVRTVSVTAAKPGAKAILSADGTLLSGWIGGGCARHAVVVAAKKALQDGQPRLVQLQPEDLLNEQGLVAGSDTDGVLIARNMCPSQGTMDIFVEPVMSNPELLVLGLSPIALSVAELGKSCGFSVATSAHNYPADNPVAPTYAKLSDIPLAHSHRYIVIATPVSYTHLTLPTILLV